MATSIALSLYFVRKAGQKGLKDEQSCWSIIWKSLIILALIVYLVYMSSLEELAIPSNDYQKALLLGWLTLLFLGAAIGFAVELQLPVKGQGQWAEPLAIRRSIQSSVGIAFLLGAVAV